jgi:hypothetical protein
MLRQQNHQIGPQGKDRLEIGMIVIPHLLLAQDRGRVAAVVGDPYHPIP